MKICCDCNIEKPDDQFGRRCLHCRDCAKRRQKSKQRERNQKFYAENREREKERARLWRTSNPEAAKEATTAWRKANRERFLAMKREWRIENPDRVRENNREYYLLHQDEINARSRAYKEENKEELAIKQAQYNRDFPEGNRFRRSLRRAAEKRATPIWADRSKMFALYTRAARLTAETGIEHHVDHIYPLQHKLMCGLHCESNLQIVPAVVNQKKKNKLPPDLGDYDQPRCCAWPSVVHFEAWIASGGAQAGVA